MTNTLRVTQVEVSGEDAALRAALEDLRALLVPRSAPPPSDPSDLSPRIADAVAHTTAIIRRNAHSAAKSGGSFHDSWRPHLATLARECLPGGCAPLLALIDAVWSGYAAERSRVGTTGGTGVPPVPTPTPSPVSTLQSPLSTVAPPTAVKPSASTDEAAVLRHMLAQLPGVGDRARLDALFTSQESRNIARRVARLDRRFECAGNPRGPAPGKSVVRRIEA